MLSREGKKYKSTITILKDGDEVNVLRLMALMKLCVKCGDTITVRIEGEDETAAAAAMQAFLSDHLYRRIEKYPTVSDLMQPGIFV